MTQRVTKPVQDTLHSLTIHWDFIAVLAIFFASFALYARTAVPGVLDGDGGEFQTNIYNLGVSHTGYPLYFLLAKLWTIVMQSGTLAYRANVFSGLLGALTLVLIYGLMRTLTERRGVALSTALLFGVSRVQWSQALIPDVYTLNSFFIVLVVWLALLWRIERVPLWWVSLAYGLSLTHHRTMFWFAPALGIFILLGAGRQLLQPRLLLTNFAALLLPFLVYLYIPLRGDSDVGVEYHARDFASMILASNASVWLKFGPPGFLWERITQVYFPLLVEQFTVIGFAFGLMGIAALALKRVPRGFPKELPARQLLLLLGLAHLAETAFAVVFWVVDSEIFFIPSYLTFLFFIGIGFALACDWLAARRTHVVLQRAIPVAVTLALFAPVLFLLLANFSRNDRSNNDEADARWQEILAQPLEPNATIMGPWEDLTPLEYYQYAENTRRDLKRDKIIVFQDQLKLAPQGDLAARVRADLQQGKTVYLTRHPGDTETLQEFSKFELAPIASLWRASLRNATRKLAGTKFDAGDELQSIGVPDKPRAGDFVSIVLNWSADAPLENMRLRWQLRDANHFTWATQESFPLGGRAITRGENSIRDLHGMFIPPDAPPGEYTLELAALERDSQNPQTLAGASSTVTQTIAVQSSTLTHPTTVRRIPRALHKELNGAQFMGYGVDNAEPRGGDILEFASWWQGLTRSDDTFEIKLRDAEDVETTLYQGTLFPQAGGEFNPAQLVRARTNLTIPPNASAGFAHILLYFNGQALPEIRVALKPSPRVFNAPQIGHPQVTQFGDAIQLRGYNLPRAQLGAGETLLLTLIWSASQTPHAGYKVFVHLLDANGVLRAQQDSIPQQGQLPTNRWFPGEYVTDDYALTLPKDLTAGAYRIAVGMYDEKTNERVILRDSTGAPLHDNRVLLDTVIQIRP